LVVSGRLHHLTICEAASTVPRCARSSSPDWSYLLRLRSLPYRSNQRRKYLECWSTVRWYKVWQTHLSIRADQRIDIDTAYTKFTVPCPLETACTDESLVRTRVAKANPSAHLFSTCFHGFSLIIRLHVDGVLCLRSSNSSSVRLTSWVRTLPSH